ncbi:HEAT repeat domain-containing protein [Phormidium tenue FACHB-886]|nr:HEAT repeat domain-containing protein [Phormidium tenue FACHB-886]
MSLAEVGARRIPFICSALAGEELQAGSRDATRIYSLLTDPELGGCVSKGYRPIIDCKSRHEFEEELFPILNSWQPKDQLVFYFSGHGEFKREQYCLKFGERDLYPFKNLLNELEAQGVSRAILIVDACRSGGIFGNKGIDTIDLESMQIPKGIAVIASSRAIQVSQELHDGSASVFTKLFCEGIETGLGGRQTNNNLITVEDIVIYIREKLDKEPAYSAFRQRPEYNIEKAESGIWITRNKSILKERTNEETQTFTSPLNSSDFLSNQNHLTYDRRLAQHHSFKDLDKKLIAIFLDQPLAKEELNNAGLLLADQQEHLQTLGIIQNEKPTLGAFLCFAGRELLVNKFASCSLHMVAYSDKKRASSTASPKTVTDNLLNLFEIGMNFFRNAAILRRTGRVGTDERDDLEIPEIALREALANALVHRDYEKAHLKDQPTRLEVYSDRIEITSYGSLMNGLSEKDLNDNPENIDPLRRNYIIAKIFLIMQRVELNASGISRMHEATHKAHLPPPIIKATDNTVKVIFRRPLLETQKGEGADVKAVIDFQSYLQSLSAEYQHHFSTYTSTDAIRKFQEPQASSTLDFGLIVQLMQPKESEDSQNLERLDKIERLPVLEGIRKYAAEHLLLIGRPGSGKSTTLFRFLIEETTKALADPSAKIPVLVELRYYQTSILDLMRLFFKRHGLLLNSDQLETLLVEQRLMLLIDGLNELPSEVARNDLMKFRQDHPLSPMIFTTRDLELAGDLGIAKKLEMQPLTATQVEAFVRSYLAEHTESMTRQLGSPLREFGQTPLLLWMLCSFFKQTGQIPTNLGGVFRAFTQSYERHLKGSITPESDRRWWAELLQTLAFAMMHSQPPSILEINHSPPTPSVELRVTISKAEAHQLFIEYLKPREAQPEGAARKALDDLLRYHLIQTTENKIEFRHQLIQEYYAAEYLLRQLPHINDKHLKRDYLNYLKWTEPLALMLTLLDDETQILRVVRAAVDVDPMLGARLAGKVQPQFQEEAISWIVKLTVPQPLKVLFLSATHSKVAVAELAQALEAQDTSIRRYAATALRQIDERIIVTRLLQALEDQDVDVRRYAVTALGKIGGEEAIIGLLQTLKDQDADVRRNAAAALGQIGGERAVTGLLQTLEDQDADVRRNAAAALGQIGGEHAVTGLLQTLEDQDADVRRNAAAALGQIGGERAVTGLLQILRHQNADVRRNAATALGKIGGEHAASALFQALEDSDASVRRNAAAALGQIGGEDVVAELLQYLKHQDADTRRNAAAALGQIGEEEAVAGLLQTLEDQDADVRKNAMVALEKIGGEGAVVGLLQALKDLDTFVRRNAAAALGQIGGEGAVTGLLQALEDSDASVRRNAAAALGQIGGEGAVTGLLQALKNQNVEVRRYAAESLGQVGGREAIVGLLQALEDQSVDVRRYTAAALGHIGGEGVVARLLQALEDPDAFVCRNAAAALGHIGGETAVSGLLQALKHHNAVVRRNAATALGHIGGETAVSGLLQALGDQNYYVCRNALAALGQVGSPASLSQLWQICFTGEVEILSTITTIQNCCKFYNYEIANGFIPKKLSLY